MKLLKNKTVRLFFITLLTLVLLIVIGFILLPISSLNPDIYEADKILNGEEGIYKDSAYYAYDKYKTGERAWPLLKFNLDYKNKLNKAEKIKDEKIKNTAAVVIFFKKTPSAERIAELTAEINQFSSVRQVKYVSPQEALSIYKEKNKNETNLLDLVTAEILPASMEVYLADWNRQSELRTSLKQNSDIEEIVTPPVPGKLPY